jgi:hypothetical protein
MNEANNLILAKKNKLYLFLDLVLILIVLLQIIAFIGRGEEDAYLSYRYALNLVRGNGLVYNVGERVEGFSNPSWTLLLAVFNYIGLPFRFTAFMMAVIFDLVIFLLLRKISISLFADTLLARLPLLMLAIFTAFHTSLDNGLEGSLWSLSLVILLFGVVYQNKTIILSGSLLTLVTRPEGIFIYGFSLAYIIYIIIKKEEYPQLKSYTGIFISLGIGLLLFFIRYIYYHDWLPNVVWSKLANGNFKPQISYLYIIKKGIVYYLRYLDVIGMLNFTLLVVSIVASRLRKDLVVFCLLLIVFNVVLVINNGGDWMFDYRLLTPYFPVYIILITITIHTLITIVKIKPGWVFGILALANFNRLIDINLLFNSLPTAPSKWVTALISDPATEYAVLVGNDSKRITVKDIMQPNEKIVLEAGGRQGYILNRFYVIEMHGLTDKEITKNNNRYTYLAPTWGKVNWIEVFKKNPDYLKFHYPAQLIDLVSLPGMKEKLANYLLFQAEPKYNEKNILLMKKDNVNISKFKAAYLYCEVAEFVNRIMSSYQNNTPEFYHKPEHNRGVSFTKDKDTVRYAINSGIALINYSIKKVGNERYMLSFVFRITERIDRDWIIYLHAKVAEKDIFLLPADRQQYKYAGWDFKPDPPTSKWQKSGTIVISREIIAKPIPYNIELGFYRVGEERYGQSIQFDWIDFGKID